MNWTDRILLRFYRISNKIGSWVIITEHEWEPLKCMRFGLWQINFVSYTQKKSPKSKMRVPTVWQLWLEGCVVSRIKSWILYLLHWHPKSRRKFAQDIIALQARSGKQLRISERLALEIPQTFFLYFFKMVFFHAGKEKIQKYSVTSQKDGEDLDVERLGHQMEEWLNALWVLGFLFVLNTISIFKV